MKWFRSLMDVVDGSKDGAYSHSATQTRMASAIQKLATKMGESPVATAYLLILVGLLGLILLVAALL